MTREARIDAAVRRVIGRRWIPQGFAGRNAVDLGALRRWLGRGAPMDAWWFAFYAAAIAEFRKGFGA